MRRSESQIVQKHCLIALFCLCILVVPVCRSYPTSVWPLETMAQAPVLATVKIEQASPSSSQRQPENGTVPYRATLLILRSFPPLAIRTGERIQLDYEGHAAGDPGMNGPDVPPIQTGSTLVVPLKSNPRPATDAWRLIKDEGIGLVIPAIERQPAFPSNPMSPRDYLLQEVASALSSGTREEVLAEAGYLAFQTTNGYSSDLMALLTAKENGNTDRWALISASLVSSLGTPRPTFRDFRAGKYADGQERWAGSLAEATMQRLGKSTDSRKRLIHQLLAISDLNEWGSGGTLQELAQEPSLVRELATMLKARRAGSLYVAYNILKAGQGRILPEAMSAAFEYLDTPRKSHSEIQAACWVVRDFGNDEQLHQLVRVVQKYQYEDRTHYDELWRDTVFSDNDRERAVLEILLADQRMYESGRRYSDIATVELARLQALKLGTR